MTTRATRPARRAGDRRTVPGHRTTRPRRPPWPHRLTCSCPPCPNLTPSRPFRASAAERVHRARGRRTLPAQRGGRRHRAAADQRAAAARRGAADQRAAARRRRAPDQRTDLHRRRVGVLGGGQWARRAAADAIGAGPADRAGPARRTARRRHRLQPLPGPHGRRPGHRARRGPGRPRRRREHPGRRHRRPRPPRRGRGTSGCCRRPWSAGATAPPPDWTRCPRAPCCASPPSRARPAPPTEGLPPGVHVLHATAPDGRTGEAHLVVAPARLPAPPGRT